MPNARPGPGHASLALLAVTAVWGATLVVVVDVIAKMPVMDFLAWRFWLAVVAMILLRPKCLSSLSGTHLRHGLLLGLLLGLGYITQTFGLAHTSATVSGFITGMFVVFTPIIAAVISKTHPPPAVWASVGLATAGLAVISLRGAALGFGELLTLMCAAFFAGHIVGLSRWSTAGDSYGLTVVQLAVVATASLIAAAAGDGLTPPPDAPAWAAVLFLALVATALSFFAQTWAQALMSAPRAAIILTMEPVFAGFFGITIGGDPLTWAIVVGGALIVAAMYVVELAPGEPAAQPRLAAAAPDPV